MRGKPESTVLVAVGANLPGVDGRSPLATCKAAVVSLALLPGLCLVATSRWYATPAEPLGSGAPGYVNGVVLLEGAAAEPSILLAALHAIEAAAGRTRPEENAPRTLDLDLIDAWGLVRAGPDPVLPHPRAQLRRFVLVPLLDVAPEWVHPSLRIAGVDLLAALPHGPQPMAIG